MPSTRSRFLRPSAPLEGPGLPGDRADSGTEAGNRRQAWGISESQAGTCSKPAAVGPVRGTGARFQWGN